MCLLISHTRRRVFGLQAPGGGAVVRVEMHLESAMQVIRWTREGLRGPLVPVPVPVLASKHLGAFFVCRRSERQIMDVQVSSRRTDLRS